MYTLATALTALYSSQILMRNFTLTWSTPTLRWINLRLITKNNLRLRKKMTKTYSMLRFGKTSQTPSMETLWKSKLSQLKLEKLQVLLRLRICRNCQRSHQNKKVLEITISYRKSQLWKSKRQLQQRERITRSPSQKKPPLLRSSQIQEARKKCRSLITTKNCSISTKNLKGKSTNLTNRCRPKPIFRKRSSSLLCLK